MAHGSPLETGVGAPSAKLGVTAPPPHFSAPRHVILAHKPHPHQPQSGVQCAQNFDLAWVTNQFNDTMAMVV